MQLLEPLEHGNVRVMEIRAVLCALLRLAEERPLQVSAHHLRSAGITGPVSGGVLADGRQLLFWQRHTRRTDIGDAL